MPVTTSATVPALTITKLRSASAPANAVDKKRKHGAALRAPTLAVPAAAPVPSPVPSPSPAPSPAPATVGTQSVLVSTGTQQLPVLLRSQKRDMSAKGVVSPTLLQQGHGSL